jgi:anaerobic ribonucleoside-triphosphate reductase activating protein
LNLRIHDVLPRSRANGPGTRYTIWVQGCSIHCPGCSNLDTWDPKGGYERSIDDIVKDIMSEIGLDGVTITGGEPLDQPEAVLELCKKLYGRISIFLTTGYTASYIAFRKNLEAFKYTDILCVGPFKKDMLCTGTWKGSSNQLLHFQTPLGREQSMMPVIPEEIYIYPDGNSLRTGFG